MKAGDLDRRIRIERPVANTALGKAGKGTWETVPGWASVPANVQDVLPSKGEQVAEGVTIANHPARVRIRPMAGIAPSMRFVIKAKYRWEVERTVEIVAGPAVLDSGGMEFMVQTWSPSGNRA